MTANVAPYADLGAASEAVQRTVDDMPAPEGFSATLGGQTLEQKKAFRGLIFAAIMALALVYMVLASQFKSLIDPLVIMFSVPLGDPADLGAALLAACLQQRSGRLALARAARDLALLLDPDLARKGSIPGLGAQNSTLPAAWGPTAVEHPLCRGPLRRVLRALAPALADVPHSGGASAEGEPLGPKAEADFQELRDQLGAPFPRAVIRGAGTDVTFAVTQPLTVVMGLRAEDLEVAELRFLVGRALEQARAGTMAVARLSVSNLRGLLRGVIRAVSLGISDGEVGEQGGRAIARPTGRRCCRSPRSPGSCPPERSAPTCWSMRERR